MYVLAHEHTQILERHNWHFCSAADKDPTRHWKVRSGSHTPRHAATTQSKAIAHRFATARSASLILSDQILVVKMPATEPDTQNLSTLSEPPPANATICVIMFDTSLTSVNISVPASKNAARTHYQIATQKRSKSKRRAKLQQVHAWRQCPTHLPCLLANYQK